MVSQTWHAAEADIPWRRAQFAGNEEVGRFVTIDRFVHAETTLEQVDNAAVLQLAARELQGVIRESEETEAVVTLSPESVGDLGMRWHRAEAVGPFLSVLVRDGDAGSSR
jgi:hypothetical protein